MNNTLPTPGFGMFLRQGGRTWPEMVERFQLADQLGFDYAWTSDHFVAGEDGLQNRLEGWTLIAGLAPLTSRIKLGVLVSGVTFRHPSLLMKEAVTVDHISSGRVIIGIGAAWHEAEHRMYGFTLPPAGVRVAMVAETLQIMHGLMTQQYTTFNGRYYTLENAPFEPKPVQKPRIPILVGTSGNKMLELTARYADMWDTIGDPEFVAERMRFLDSKCKEIGRDPSEIRRFIREPEDDSVATSVDKFLDFYNRYRSLGFTDFTIDFPKNGDVRTLEKIATEVIPELRNA